MEVKPAGGVMRLALDLVFFALAVGMLWWLYCEGCRVGARDERDRWN